MIIKLRKFIQNYAAQWLGGILLFALGFGLFYTPTARRASTEHAWAITINDDPVWLSQLRQRSMAERTKRDLIRAQYGEYAQLIMQLQGWNTKPEVQAMQSLVREVLFDQTAHKVGIQFNNDYVRMNMVRIQSELINIVPLELFNPDGTLQQRKVALWLMTQGLPENYLEQKIADMLRRQLLVDFTQAAVYVPTYVLDHQVQLQTAPRSFSLLTLPLEEQLKKVREQDISTDELKTFYQHESEKGRYWVPEKRTATVWTFDTKKYGVTIGDDEIQDYYDDHKVQSYLKEPTKIQVRRILFAVQDESERGVVFDRAQEIYRTLQEDPAQFAALAQQISDDKKSADQGGLLPFFSRGEYERSFEKTAFTLKADGDISSIITTKQGFEIVQRVEKKKPTFIPLKEVAREIEQKVLDKKFSSVFVRDARALIDRFQAGDTSSLETFIKERKGEPSVLKGIARDNAEWGSVLFRLKPGEITYHIESKQGIIVRLDTREKRYLPTLDVLENIVKDDLYGQRARRALHDLVSSVQKEVVATPLDVICNKVGGSLETKKAITAQNKEATQFFQKHGISVEKAFQIEKIGGMVTNFSDQGAALVRLDAWNTDMHVTTTEEQAATVRTVKETESAYYTGGFVASLCRNATIKSNTETEFDEPLQDRLGMEE